MSDHTQYLEAYTQLVFRSWSSDEYFQSVINDPRTAVTEAGLEVPTDATIHVTVVDSTGSGSIEDQIARWDAGATSGVYELVIARKPADFDPSNFELSEEQLENVDAGAGVYCCCCPCCCCG